jgi:cold shock CspA family protein
MKITPLPETARFIAKVLAARKTPTQEIPALIAMVHEGVTGLLEPPRQAVVAALAPSLPPPLRVKRAYVRRAGLLPAEPAIPAPPPTPRLMRRADVAVVKPAEPQMARPTTRAALRGLVKWYDPRARAGALRLPGYAGDVAVGPDALDRAGIPRLFKGQEIEASVTESDGEVHLVTLSLPGRPETDPFGGGPLGARRRDAKPVVIEMKRDGLRRVAARVEAEQLLGVPRPPPLSD